LAERENSFHNGNEMSTEVKVTYFDTAMVLIEIGSVRLLTDPLFDGGGASFDHGPVHLEKTSECAITPAALGRIDAVLLSHDQHADNLDSGGRAFLPTVRQVLTTPDGAARLAGVRAFGLDSWAQARVDSPQGDYVVVTAVPAQHGPDGTQEVTGPVTGFMIEWPALQSGPVYVSGDTILFGGTSEIALRYAPVSLALLNLGRVKLEPMGQMEFSMSANQALAYAAALRPAWMVPLHFEGWRHFSESREQAADLFAKSEFASRTQWLIPGESATFAL
jgi:L-ascorbate metabolism protein UlaG (beta-lactamase superfamily)